MTSEKVDEKTPIKNAEVLPAIVPVQEMEPMDYVEPKENSEKVVIEEFKYSKEMKNYQIALLVILTVETVLALLYLIQHSIRLGQLDSLPSALRMGPLSYLLIYLVIIPVTVVIFFTLYIIAVAKYHRVGILVLAWLSIIGAVLVFIVFIVAVTVVALLNHYEFGPFHIGVAKFSLILSFTLISFLCTIVVIVLSFKLANLLGRQAGYEYI